MKKPRFPLKSLYATIGLTVYFRGMKGYIKDIVEDEYGDVFIEAEHLDKSIRYYAATELSLIDDFI